ncbi:MAG: hypothetical protein M1834_007592 [Cirrosporium novae-zelandiae]|nr:MAG: hypothetical protein M1834_007592 [Cirrosporium novae-zelandiae]
MGTDLKNEYSPPGDPNLACQLQVEVISLWHAGIEDLMDFFAVTNRPHPLLETLFRDPEHKAVYKRAVDRELDIIMKRSLDLNLNELNKYQKALYALMNLDENDKEKFGAMELYLLGILGVSDDGNIEDLYKALNIVESSQVLAEKGGLKHALPAKPPAPMLGHYHVYPPGTFSPSNVSPDGVHKDEGREVKLEAQDSYFHASSASGTNKSGKPLGSDSHTSLSDNVTARSRGPSTSLDGHALSRLWKVYDRAKEEFSQLPDIEPNTIEKAQKAQFLRDTVENLFSFVGRDKLPPFQYVDLHETLKVTRDYCEKSFGGSKRKFDPGYQRQAAPNRKYDRYFPRRASSRAPRRDRISEMSPSRDVGYRPRDLYDPSRRGFSRSPLYREVLLAEFHIRLFAGDMNSMHDTMAAQMIGKSIASRIGDRICRDRVSGP